MLQDRFGHAFLLQQPEKTTERRDSPAMKPGNKPVLTVLCRENAFIFFPASALRTERGQDSFSFGQKIGSAHKQLVLLAAKVKLV